MEQAQPPSAQVRAAAALRIAHTLGCAPGAADSPAVDAAMRYAVDEDRRARVGAGRTLWGEQSPARDPDAAALVDGVKARYLDVNDAYHGLEPIHPSDVIAGVYATAMESGVSPEGFVDAVVVAYEVAMAADDLIAPTPRGFDSVNLTMLGAVAACARILRLDAGRTGQALAIGVTSHVARRRTRAGGLNLWKAFAAAAARHARYATSLAQAGVRGPEEPFVVRRGLFELVLGQRPDAVATPELGLSPGRVVESQLKAFPCGSTAEAPSEAALELVRRGVRLQDVHALEIRVGPEGLALHAGPDKLHPRTREAADHSIPFVIVSTLALGRLDEASFDEIHVNDPRPQRFLAEQVCVVHDPQLDAGHDAGFSVVLRVRTVDDTDHEIAVTGSEGSPANPMSRGRTRAAFVEQVVRLAVAERADELWTATLALGIAHGDLDRLDGLLGAG